MLDKLREPKNWLYATLIIAAIWVLSTWLSDYALGFATLFVICLIFWRVNDTWAFTQLMNDEMKQIKELLKNRK